MNRTAFLKSALWLTAGAAAARNLPMNLHQLKNSTDSLLETAAMPVLFVGHGSPMNGIEDNAFTRKWEQLGKTLPRPAAVLVISAHWLTKGTKVTAMDHPRTIHDFGGFPKELFNVQYPAPGSLKVAEETKALIKSTPVALDHDWGLDHGAWSVVKKIYPGADIPVLQLSIDYNQPARYHYNLGRELAALRKKGVLILGSGNMVHNLGMAAFDKINAPEYGYDWALEMKHTFRRLIENRQHEQLINYQGLGKAALLAIPTPDHYYPLLYSLALQLPSDEAELFNDVALAGSLTMTGVQIGKI